MNAPFDKYSVRYTLSDGLHNKYSRKCNCGYTLILDLSLPEQPEYWTCNKCGSKNKTLWTPSGELQYESAF